MRRTKFRLSRFLALVALALGCAAAARAGWFENPTIFVSDVADETRTVVAWTVSELGLSSYSNNDP